MPTYQVRFTAASATTVGSPLKVRYGPDCRVTVSGHPASEFDLRRGFPIQLSFDVGIEQVDIEEAAENVHWQASHLVDVLAAAGGAAIEMPLFDFAFDATPGVVDRAFRQDIVFADAAALKSTVVHKSDLDVFFSRAEAVATDAKLYHRVRRALYYFRSAAETSDIYHRFRDLWTGLEALNKPLIVKHELVGATVGRSCPNCGNAVTWDETSTGIRFAIEHLVSDQPMTWRQLRALRRTLFHSVWDRSNAEIVSDVLAGGEVLRDCLLAAIRDVLGMGGTQGGIRPFDCALPRWPRITLNTTFRRTPLNPFLTDASRPRFEVKPGPNGTGFRLPLPLAVEDLPSALYLFNSPTHLAAKVGLTRVRWSK